MFTVDDIGNELDDLDDEALTREGLPPDLPLANEVLIFGILAVLVPVLGFFFGILAVSNHRTNKDIYVFDKERYKVSFKRSQIGFGLGITGMALTFLSLIAWYIFRTFWFLWIILWIFALLSGS